MGAPGPGGWVLSVLISLLNRLSAWKVTGAALLARYGTLHWLLALLPAGGLGLGGTLAWPGWAVGVSR